MNTLNVTELFTSKCFIMLTFMLYISTTKLKKKQKEKENHLKGTDVTVMELKCLHFQLQFWYDHPSNFFMLSQ